MKRILLCALSAFMLFGCTNINLQEPKYTELINNSEEYLVIRVDDTEKNYRLFYLEPSERTEFLSFETPVSILFPYEWRSFGDVIIHSDENISIEINPDGFFIERF